VDYVISTPGHHKAKRLCHVNMLKANNEKHVVQCIPKPVSVVSLPSSAPSDVTRQMMVEYEPKASVKLRNCDVLRNLEVRLSHLPERQ